MLARIRKRATLTHLVVAVAFLLALSGGAYAANHYLITSIKQISPSVLKKLKGATGATGQSGTEGKAGASGTQGPQGLEGKAGTNGTNGTNGESVTTKEVKTSEAECSKLGGASFTVGSKTIDACNGKEGKEGKEGPEGKEGSPWTAGGVLPKGKLETGVWQNIGSTQTGVEIPIPISFPIPTAKPVTGHYVTEEEVATSKVVSGCAGNAEKPEALAGNLCVFQANDAELSGVEKPEFNDPGAGALSGKFTNALSDDGTVLVLKTQSSLKFGETLSYGTWAVAGD